MSTYLLDFIEQLDEKWKEIDILLDEAKKHEESRSSLYNAICRSITVLIVAHLEGFTKDIVKAVIKDINQEYKFGQIPIAMQRTYCRKYIGEATEKGGNHDHKINILIAKFSDMECGISYEPFLSYSNKNPKPNVIQKIFDNFGIKDVFKQLTGSIIDEVFSDSDRVIEEKIIALKKYVTENITTFPYTCSLDRLALIDNKNTSKTKKQRSLWESFLDDINHQRHEVAHGNNFENGESFGALNEIKNKVVYFQLELVSFMAVSLINSIQPNDMMEIH